jgi:hypothetical protein
LRAAGTKAEALVEARCRFVLCVDEDARAPDGMSGTASAIQRIGEQQSPKTLALPPSPAISRSRCKLFAQHTPQGLLERFGRATDVFAQCGVDQGLVITAPRRVYFSLEPLQHVVVEPNRDSSLAGRERSYRTTTCRSEIVGPSHHLS